MLIWRSFAGGGFHSGNSHQSHAPQQSSVWHQCAGAHEVRDLALSSSHSGLSVNLSHEAQITKGNDFQKASLSMLLSIWTIAFISKMFMMLLFLSASRLSVFFISLEIIIWICELGTHSLLVYTYIYIFFKTINWRTVKIILFLAAKLLF